MEFHWNFLSGIIYWYILHRNQILRKKYIHNLGLKFRLKLLGSLEEVINMNSNII